MKESAEKIPAEEKTKVEAALTEARKFTASTELAEIEKATQDLTTASNQMAEILYKNVGNTTPGADAGAQAAGGADAAGAKDKKDEDVIDADFKQV